MFLSKKYNEFYFNVVRLEILNFYVEIFFIISLLQQSANIKNKQIFYHMLRPFDSPFMLQRVANMICKLHKFSLQKNK